jgi:hypothetical protein
MGGRLALPPPSQRSTSAAERLFPTCREGRASIRRMRRLKSCGPKYLEQDSALQVPNCLAGSLNQMMVRALGPRSQLSHLGAVIAIFQRGFHLVASL